jgi:VWFA-related protein
MRRRLLTLLVVLVLLPSGPLDAQEKTEPRETDFEEIEEVRLVQIAILARDRQGRPVDDLTADEIFVKDRGEKMRVAFLDPFIDRYQDDGPVPEARLYVGAPGGWEGVQTASQVEPRYIAFFIDIENDQKLRKDEALADLIRFAEDYLDASYRAAVVSYDGEVNLEVPFTQDRAAVVAGLRRAFGRGARPDLDIRARVQSLIRNMETCGPENENPYAFVSNADEECLRGVALEYSDERRPATEDYFDALDNLIRFVSGLKGRKTVLAMSHGRTADPVIEVVEAMRAVYGNNEQVSQLRLDLVGEGARIRLDELMSLALTQQVTLHFVDRNSAPSGDYGAANKSGHMPGARPMLAAFLAPQMDLEEMAVHTGGVFQHTPDNLYRGLKRAIDLERGGYLLGYYVENYLSPKRLRKVTIGTSRKATRIFHRRGYYEIEARAAALAGEISMGAPVSLEEEGKKGFFYPFRMSVSPLELGYVVEDQVAGATLTLHFQVEWWNGRVLTDSYHFLNHGYPRDLWEAGEIEPITINGWVELPPGKYRLVASLKNVRIGFGGELVADVEVPEIGDPGSAPEAPESSQRQ